MKVSLEEFKELLAPVTKYMTDFETVNKGVSLFCPGSYAVVELGGDLLDNYLSLLQKYLGIREDALNWYVFENDLGKDNLEMFIDDEKFVIDNLDTFYGVLSRMYEKEAGDVLGE